MYKLSKVVLITLFFSVVTFCGCKKNKPPDTPSTPSGPTSGIINTEYTFSSSAEDPNEDSVAIRFDWEDGDTSNWSSWVESGISVSMSHSWSDSGTYFIKAQAKNIKDATSEWSEVHQIVIFNSWTKTFGGSDDDCGYSVQQTSDGGYIITGFTVSFGAGYGDVYLIKTDNNGNEHWSKTFGGLSDDWGYSVQQTTDGGYIIVGSTEPGVAGEGDVYLIKSDSNGNQQWSKTFGGELLDYGFSVHQTSDDGYIITGETESYGADEITDVYLIKTDGNGNEQWSKAFGGTEADWGLSVQPTSDGGYIVTGVTGSYGAGGSDVFLIKIDASGNQQWYKTFGGLSDDWGLSVQQTLDGGYIITGVTVSYGAGWSDVYLIKTDGNGNEQWSKTFGGLSADWGYSVQQTTDNGYIIAGFTTSYGSGGTDAYLIKTDVNGNQQWYMTFGGSSDDYGYSIGQTSDGGYIITGYTYSFGEGGSDVYLIKINANGNAK